MNCNGKSKITLLITGLAPYSALQGWHQAVIASAKLNHVGKEVQASILFVKEKNIQIKLIPPWRNRQDLLRACAIRIKRNQENSSCLHCLWASSISREPEAPWRLPVTVLGGWGLCILTHNNFHHTQWIFYTTYSLQLGLGVSVTSRCSTTAQDAPVS